MSDLNTALAESKAALDQLMTAGERAAATWTTPRAEGKWSPSQIVEHVARALEEAGKGIKGEPNALPSLPGFVRPVIRVLFFNRVVKNNKITNNRTNKAMNPIAGPTTPVEGRARLQQAHEPFDSEGGACPQRFNRSMFGDVSTSDYARCQAIHTLHHHKQIPRAPGYSSRSASVG